MRAIHTIVILQDNDSLLYNNSKLVPDIPVPDIIGVHVCYLVGCDMHLDTRYARVRKLT